MNMVFGVTTMALLRRTILAPLTRLNSEISRIGESRDLSMRVTSSGEGELFQLSGAVNTTLEALQNGDKQFSQLFGGIRQVFWVKDELTQEIAYISPPWEGSSGIKREHLYAGSSQEWLDSVYAEDKPTVAEMLERQQTGVKGEAEFRIIGPEEEIWWTWCRYYPVFNGSGRLIETVGLSEDITEHKNTEEVMVRSHDELWNAMSPAPTVPRP